MMLPMKKLLIFFILLIFVLVFFLGNWIAKEIFESVVARLTGFKTVAAEFDLNPFKGTVHIERLTLFNPRGFEQRVFASIPEIDLAIDLPAAIKKERTRIYLLKLAIEELNIENSRAGVSNISLLRSAKAKEKPEAAKGASPKEEKKPVPFYLDRFELTLRRVSYRDQSKLIPANVALDMKIEGEVFEGIDSPAAIVNLVLLKVVTRSPFGNLGLDPSALQEKLEKTVSKTLTVGEELLKEKTTVLAEKAESRISGILGKVKNTLKVVEESSQNR